MSTKQVTDENVSVHVENLGGIDETDVEVTSGVTVLAGRNATNRTSFLQSVAAALGSEQVPLKGDADEGRVELTIGGETYTRTATRQNGSVVTGGDPYLEDPELADLFAFLLASNEARQAVARGDDLRELIMRPIDIGAIQAEIDRAETERDEWRAELDELDELERRLPGLEEERQGLQDEIEAVEEELAAKRHEIEEADADVEESREEKEALEEKLDELNDVRSDLEQVRFRLETEEESIEALEAERDDLEAELDDLPEHPGEDVADIETRIERLRERERSLESDLSELGNVIGFNEELLESAGDSVWGDLVEDADDGAITDPLVAEDDAVVCWTCGTEVERDRIQETVDRLRELREAKLGERDEVREELDELTEERRELEADSDRREEVADRIETVEAEIQEREDSIDELRDREEELVAEIETLEADVDELEDEDYGEILDLHREANDLEFQRRELEDDLEEVEAEIESIEDRLTERDEIEDRLDEVKAELTDLRTRIDQIEADAVEEFNQHMDEVLERLEYANVERIWIERIGPPPSESGGGEDRTFDLHVVRSTESGTTYEDTIHHLSESEREVTGLVFALAGYLVHEVYETCPFILLDSLETIDADRIAALVEYLGEFTDYLLVALLPEDAAALDEAYERVTSI